MTEEQRLFHGAKLKVRRGNQHIGELGQMLDAFVNCDPARFVQEQDTDTGHYVLKFKMVKPLPEHIALIIGDALHNLRAALDLLMWELVALCGGTPGEWLQFPIKGDLGKLQSYLGQERIQIIGNDIITLLEHDIKPYKEGNYLLWALHKLDISDKHRMLISSTPNTVETNVSGWTGNTLEDRNVYMNCTFTVGGNNIICVEARKEAFQFYMVTHDPPKVAVLFGKEEEVLSGKPVIPTLGQFSQLASDVIQKVENAYLARS